ncbi:hypothetical protein TNCV_3177891 [Trichonephila clavipes]|nr:hypothetical protein TNCV_3177891 [Trichonephila clavipes]
MFKITSSVAKIPRIVSQCDVNNQIKSYIALHLFHSILRENISGSGGLEVTCPIRNPKIAGSIPAGVDRFARCEAHYGNQILSWWLGHGHELVADAIDPWAQSQDQLRTHLEKLMHFKSVEARSPSIGVV